LKTPKTLEDRGYVIVNEHKELNLGTTEESHVIHVSFMLTPEKEKGYFSLLFDYEVVFT